jgi:hypothetical protein
MSHEDINELSKLVSTVYFSNISSVSKYNNNDIKFPILSHIMVKVVESNVDYEVFNVTQLINFSNMFIRAPTNFYLEERAKVIRKF